MKRNSAQRQIINDGIGIIEEQRRKIAWRNRVYGGMA